MNGNQIIDCSSLSRRRFLSQAGGGMGMLALAALTAGETNLAAAKAKNPIAAKKPHFKPRVKRVIWLFMHGGPSHVDLLDPKPSLIKYAGKPLPASFGKVMTRRDVSKNPLLQPVKPFKPRGKSGLEISDFLPHLAQCADDLCVIRSMHGDSVNHPQAVYQSNTGNILFGHPSVGSWVTYGLGTENENMPAFLVMPDPSGGVKGGPLAWGSGYLPATYQGTMIRPGKTPILNLKPQHKISSKQQRTTLDLINRLNQQHLQQRDADDDLSARISAYELAFQMQAKAPELVDISRETKETKKLYGVDEKQTSDFGTRCLLARRMIEKGVRFVQLYSGSVNGWDAHTNLARNHSYYCQKTDKPIAGLLKDLKRRGLLKDTLVIWGGEFGRMPMGEGRSGRDHNPWGYSYWLAGGGVKGGTAYGATDEIGLRAVENKVAIYDLHATILHMLGINFEELTYYHNGLDNRLTGQNKARVVKEIFS